jgi:tight adherence protein B
MEITGTPTWLTGLITFAAIMLVVIALSLFWEGVRTFWQGRTVQRQLGRLSGRAAKAEKQFSRSLMREAEETRLAFLEPVVDFMSRNSNIKLLLHQADSPWSVGTYVLLTLGLAAACALTVVAVGGRVPGAVIAGMIGMAVPNVYLKFRKRRRMAAFEENFPESIELLGRSIRAGHAFPTGLQIAADESPEPISSELRQVFEENKFGLPLKDSLDALIERVDLVDVRIFVTAVLVQREVGGNLGEILDNIAHTIRDRFRIRRQLRVYTAQGRMTSYILGALPILVGLGIYALNPDYMIVMFQEPAGRLALATAGFMQLFGYLWIRRIIDIEI